MGKKLDINTVIGFVLMGGIFAYMMYFNQPAEEAQEVSSTVGNETPQEEAAVADSAVAVEAAPLEDQQVNSDVAPTDSMAFIKAYAKYGPFAESQLRLQESGPAIYRLENENLELEVSSLGGQLVKARLKGYQTYDSLPLHLIKDNSNFNLSLSGDKPFQTTDLLFEAHQVDEQTLEMHLLADDGSKLVYRYHLPQEGFMLDLDLYSKNLGDLIEKGKNRLTFELRTLRQEKNLEGEQTLTALEYRYANDDDVDELNGSDSEEELVEESVQWIAFKQQFFSSIFYRPTGQMDQVKLVHDVLAEDGFTKYLAFSAAMAPSADGDLEAPFKLYLGPNKYEILKSHEAGFEELIPLGWGIFGWINRFAVIPVFNWLDGYGLNYGIIILIIAVLFKMVLFPLTYQSYRSMAKTRVLKPEIDELNEKYKDKDPMKKQQATMELYSKAGVNPLGGCLPVLFQMPILIALFRFFPASIELRQESFLWAKDLSTYDSIYALPFEIPFYGDHISLFTLLMTVSTLIYTYMNQQLTGSAQNQQFPQMKYLIYLMPIMFLGFFNNYAAGLSYYYFVANMITFGQQFAIRSFLDENKIRAKIQKKKESPKKENRLMRRMKEMQEQQNRQARRKK